MRPRLASHRTNVLLLVGALFVGGLAAGVIVQRLASSSGSATTTTDKLNGIHSAAPAQRASVAKHPPRRAPVSAEATTELAPNAMTSFDALRRELPGPVEVAVMPVGSSKATIFGSDEPAHGWSTTKIPVIAALMTALGSRELGYEQQSEVRSAITKSSNEAILSLFHALEGIKDGLVGASEAVEAELPRQWGPLHHRRHRTAAARSGDDVRSDRVGPASSNAFLQRARRRMPPVSASYTPHPEPNAADRAVGELGLGLCRVRPRCVQGWLGA